MSQNETARRPARFDARAATAAAVMFGLLGGGATPRQAGDPPAAPPTASQPGPADAATPPAPKPAAAEPPPQAPRVPAAPSQAAAGAGALAPEDVQALRADATARLKELAPPADGEEKVEPDPERKVADKALVEILEARLRKLDDHDKLAADLAEAARPEADPARKIAEAKAEIADVESRLTQPIEALTPPLFRGDGPVDPASRDQMKEVIAAARKDVADYQEKIAAAPADPEKEARAAIAALKAERDKVSQNLESIKARAEALASAPEPEAPAERRQAAERAVDVRVDVAVEALRLQVAERKLARAAKSAEAAAVDRTRWVVRDRLARRMLEPMEARFRKIAEAQEHDLQRQARTELAKADRELEPIARYRAERQAELLDLEAAVVKTEQVATVSVEPSLEEMKKQATVASSKFARIRQLVEGEEKRPGRIDVLHINADYKRLQPERRRIEREERAVVSKRLADHVNMLASVELSQIEDGLLDQIDLDDLLDRLPPDRHAEATAAWREMEDKHTGLLRRRRDALEQLVRREQATLDEIDRRLEILEEATSFIRTHLFWVRDQDPIGGVTVSLAAGEARRLARVAAGLAHGTATTTGWKSAKPEFLAAAAAVALLPLGILRVRLALKRKLAEMLPPPSPPPSPAAVDGPVAPQA
ncbi:hypothetical protein [Paludisphaera sp.]|uniref:hypothetical protein n=1 Tax=Paludisphaera sp. TaxID=2017432 RepID=UPI00301E0D22